MTSNLTNFYLFRVLLSNFQENLHFYNRGFILLNYSSHRIMGYICFHTLSLSYWEPLKGFVILHWLKSQDPHLSPSCSFLSLLPQGRNTVSSMGWNVSFFQSHFFLHFASYTGTIHSQSVETFQVHPDSKPFLPPGHFCSCPVHGQVLAAAVVFLPYFPLLNSQLSVLCAV